MDHEPTHTALPEGCWLGTDRLALRRMTGDDLEWFVALYSDPEVTRYLGWITVERAGGHPVGFHLINHIQGEAILQVGFGLASNAWRKGYATEMGLALLRYAFVDLKLDGMAGMTGMDDLASLRVLENIGLERRGERAFSHPAYAAAGPLAWFEIERGRWLAEHR